MTDELLRELDAWTAERHTIPTSLLPLLAKIRAAVVYRDRYKAALDLMRIRYEECAQCHCALQPSETAPHCDDHCVDDEHLHAWDEALSAAAPGPPKPPCKRCGGSGRWHPAGGVETPCPECQP
jgi:hypothetical protein